MSQRCFRVLFYTETDASACLLCPVIPAEKAEVVDHGLRQEPLLPELAH